MFVKWFIISAPGYYRRTMLLRGRRRLIDRPIIVRAWWAAPGLPLAHGTQNRTARTQRKRKKLLSKSFGNNFRADEVLPVIVCSRWINAWLYYVRKIYISHGLLWKEEINSYGWFILFMIGVIKKKLECVICNSDLYAKLIQKQY